MKIRQQYNNKVALPMNASNVTINDFVVQYISDKSGVNVMHRQPVCDFLKGYHTVRSKNELYLSDMILLCSYYNIDYDQVYKAWVSYVKRLPQQQDK